MNYNNYYNLNYSKEQQNIKTNCKKRACYEHTILQIHPTTAGGSKQHPPTQTKTKCLSLHGPQSVRESCGHLHSQINDDDDDMAYNTRS